MTFMFESLLRGARVGGSLVYEQLRAIRTSRWHSAIRRARRSQRRIDDDRNLRARMLLSKVGAPKRVAVMTHIRTLLALTLCASSTNAATVMAPGVDLIPGTFVAGTQPDGNTVVFEAPDGLVVFDTGRHAAHTQTIVDFATAAKKPVVAIVNSHWHLDHVGGNVLLRKTYPNVRVYASGAIDDALHVFLASYHSQLEDAIAKSADDATKTAPLKAEIALIDAGATLAPDERIAQSGTRAIAGRTFRMGLESNAVTAGDVWLYDPATRVLASGDLVTLPAPLFDTACAERWREALGRLEKVGFTTLIPGHGAPMSRTGFAAYRRAFDRLLRCAASKSAKSACIDDWMNEAGSLIPSSDEKLARSLLDYYIDGSLRAKPQASDALCGS
jgi:glyoxylase-like metal-dependent hydrolase (beta-lactamase superfamily II)